ncbi:hypothetical protein QGN29_02750 [Temperatibacter marinus]|uniref:Uncharacterized protein n=1 Tax=Temperatibacter marinus TaxID=1456591 RepID=A0AA52ED68_9PROT|nr:hypothetical protein [Temperatibacter marinus]WND03287.1 hypothetical protein QGN29_02750 [Temperatibacter marinus]
MTLNYEDYPGIDPAYIPEWRVYSPPAGAGEHLRFYVKDDDHHWQHVANFGWPEDDWYFRLWYEDGMEDSYAAWQVASSIGYYLVYLPMQKLQAHQKRDGTVPLMDAEEWFKSIWVDLVGYCNSAATHHSDVLWRHIASE